MRDILDWVNITRLACFTAVPLILTTVVARPTAEHREDWAAHIQRYGGLRGSSDRLRDLDQWGLQTTRQLLSAVPPPNPFPPDPTEVPR